MSLWHVHMEMYFFFLFFYFQNVSVDPDNHRRYQKKQHSTLFETPCKMHVLYEVVGKFILKTQFVTEFQNSNYLSIIESS